MSDGTSRTALAYNLSIEGIHTYHVGRAEILVHNTCDLNGLMLSKNQGSKLTTGQASGLAEWLGYAKVSGRQSHGQAIYTNGKNFISPDADTHSLGVWKMASKVDGFGAKTRLGTYDALLQWYKK
ncbi:hypothetical protein StoSoilB5_11800 [Arthrobacter sp. StoSoilB5]|nr:hypothetical protein StoSoilB5_11800 [Arthrobacter sp. StoSoilB5]